MSVLDHNVSSIVCWLPALILYQVNGHHHPCELILIKFIQSCITAHNTNNPHTIYHQVCPFSSSSLWCNNVTKNALAAKIVHIINPIPYRIIPHHIIHRTIQPTKLTIIIVISLLFRCTSAYTNPIICKSMIIPRMKPMSV